MSEKTVSEEKMRQLGLKDWNTKGYDRIFGIQARLFYSR